MSISDPQIEARLERLSERMERLASLQEETLRAMRANLSSIQQALEPAAAPLAMATEPFAAIPTADPAVDPASGLAASPTPIPVSSPVSAPTPAPRPASVPAPVPAPASQSPFAPSLAPLSTPLSAPLAATPPTSAPPTPSPRPFSPPAHPPAHSTAPAPLYPPAPLRAPAETPSLTIAAPWKDRPAEWWIARTGIAFLVVGVLYLLSDAIRAGWLSPPARCMVAVVIGAALVAWGFRENAASARKSGISMPELLLGGGLAIWAGTFWAASAWYGLIPPGVAVVGITAVTVLGMAIAWSNTLPALATVSLIGAYLIPVEMPNMSVDHAAVPVPMALIWAVVLSLLAAGMYVRRGWQRSLWIAAGGTIAILDPVLSIVRQAVYAKERASHIPYAILDAASRGILREQLMVAVAIWGIAIVGALAPIAWAWRQRGTEPFRDPATPPTPSARALTSQTSLAILAPLRMLPALAVLWAALNQSDVWGATDRVIGRELYALALVAAALSFLTRNRPTWALTRSVRVWIAIWAMAGLLLAVPMGFAWAVVVEIHVLLAWLFMITTDRDELFRPVPRIAAAALYTCITLAATSAQSAPEATFARVMVAVIVGGLVLAVGIRDARTADTMNRRGVLIPSPQKKLNWTLALTLVLIWLLPAAAVASRFQPFVTIGWALLSSALFIVSDRIRRPPWIDPASQDTRRRPFWRIAYDAALIGLATVTAKLVLIDMQGASSLWRMVAFLGCGTLFLVVAARLKAPPGTPRDMPQDMPWDMPRDASRDPAINPEPQAGQVD